MAFEILMPKLSSTMDEGSVTQWFKEEGDSIEVGEAIFEVMTDKIAIEVESYEEGVLLRKYYDVDEMVPINSVIGYIGEVGEEIPEKPPVLTSDKPKLSNLEQQEPSVQSDVKETNEKEKMTSQEGVRATPAARKLAREQGLALDKIFGSGTNGRIHVIDIVNHQPISSGQVDLVNQETIIPWRGMRKIIADQMLKSKTEIPHVTMNADVNMAEVIKLRKQLLPVIEEQTGYRISYTEIIIKAVTVALEKHPKLNAITKDDGVHQFSEVNIGVAVALAEGLIVPVIPRANRLGLADLTIATKEHAANARAGKLQPDSMKHGTFTISSLGNSVVKSFNPVINLPEVAILGVGTIYDTPQASVSGEIVMGKQLTLSLSFDHRALDGAPVADFLTTLVSLLENPYGLLV